MIRFIRSNWLIGLRTVVLGESMFDAMLAADLVQAVDAGADGWLRPVAHQRGQGQSN
jgi:hypothetical protein